MTRLEMLNKAEQFAYYVVHSSSALSDEHFAKLKKLNKEKAIQQLAKEILESAVDDFDSCCEE